MALVKVSKPASSSGGSSGSGSPRVQTLSGTLAESDFSFAEEVETYRTSALIYGDAGHNKTTFGVLHTPDPVVLINFDRRWRPAVKRAHEAGRRVGYVEVDYPANVTQLTDEMARRIGQQAVDKTIRNFEAAVNESLKGNVRTIVLDTATEYGEIVTLSVRGRLDKVRGDFGESKNLINRQWWRLLNMAREGKAHLVVLSRAKAIWEDNKPVPGAFTFRCPDVVHDGCDWAAHIRLREGASKKQRGQFELRVTKAVNTAELGEVYRASEWEGLGGPFVYACMLQYEGSGVEDWQ